MDAQMIHQAMTIGLGICIAVVALPLAFFVLAFFVSLAIRLWPLFGLAFIYCVIHFWSVLVVH